MNKKTIRIGQSIIALSEIKVIGLDIHFIEDATLVTLRFYLAGGYSEIEGQESGKVATEIFNKVYKALKEKDMRDKVITVINQDDKLTEKKAFPLSSIQSIRLFKFYDTWVVAYYLVSGLHVNEEIEDESTALKRFDEVSKLFEDFIEGNPTKHYHYEDEYLL